MHAVSPLGCIQASLQEQDRDGQDVDIGQSWYKKNALYGSLRSASEVAWSATGFTGFLSSQLTLLVRLLTGIIYDLNDTVP